MPPEGITPTLIITVVYYVLNITSFLFPSDGLYLGGWIRYLDFISKHLLNLAPASLLASQLASANNIYFIFSMVMNKHSYLSTRLVDRNNIKMLLLINNIKTDVT